MRKSSNSKNNGLRHDQFNLLIDVILRMENKKELAALIRLLFTESERAIIEQRLDIMRMLAVGKNYQEIFQTLGVSATTIIRAAKALKASRQKLRRTLIGWRNQPEQEIVSQPSTSGDSGNFFRATKPGAIRRVQKYKRAN